MQCFSPPQMHFILTKYFPDKSTVSPCDRRPGRNPFCLLSPHLCAHLPKQNVCMGLKRGKEWGRWDKGGISAALLCKGISWSMEDEVRFGISSPLFSMVPHGAWHMILNTLLSAWTCAFVYLMYMCGSLPPAVTETTSDLCSKQPSPISLG